MHTWDIDFPLMTKCQLFASHFPFPHFPFLISHFLVPTVGVTPSSGAGGAPWPHQQSRANEYSSSLESSTLAGGTVEQFPSGVLPTSLHLALLELVTSGFCSAVLRFVKCEVTPLLKVRPYFFILILPTFMARPPQIFLDIHLLFTYILITCFRLLGISILAGCRLN